MSANGDNNSHVGSTDKTRTRHVESGPDDIRQVLEVNGRTAKVLHADGTIDIIDTDALGGEADSMPTGYYRSPQFIGTVVVSECDQSAVTNDPAKYRRPNASPASLLIWVGFCPLTHCERLIILAR